MDELNSILNFLLYLIPIGAGARIGYCFLMISVNEEDSKTLKIRARNAAVFAVIAECTVPFVKLIFSYFGR